MARIGRGKTFETTDGVPPIPVQNRVLKLWLDLSEEKSLKQRMDFQQSQCKKMLKVWLDLEEEKSLKQRMDFQQSQCKKMLKLWEDLEEEKSLKQRMDF